MCIVCTELAKGTITRKEAFGAFAEVVRARPQEENHIAETKLELIEQMVEERLTTRLGKGPWAEFESVRERNRVYQELFNS